MNIGKYFQSAQQHPHNKHSAYRDTNNHAPPTASPDDPYRVVLTVGAHTFEGCGITVQAARHDAAARAIDVLRPITEQQLLQTLADDPNGDPNADLKSPISQIHEIALKRSLTVEFRILSEKGPPHMKSFVTQCVVGHITVSGSGTVKREHGN